VVAGIEHMHDKGVVHGDLKGVSPGYGGANHALTESTQANVMIDDSGHAKLIDFGLSRLIDSEDGLAASTVSSIRWCAPELLRSDTRTTKSSDVYAFASTALEVSSSSCSGVRC
jgi:serine/threonine protein kinase